jgi:hypothetical protein
MKSETPIVLRTAAERRYIESLPIPQRQGAYKCQPVKRLSAFNKNKLPKNLFNSMDSVKLEVKQLSLLDLCTIPCIDIQRDVEMHKGNLLTYLLSKDDVSLSTMSNIQLAYIEETGEYVIVDGNTRIALCRDELIREIKDHKDRRFSIPEYFNATIHHFKTQEDAKQAYKTYDNSNAVESVRQKLGGALYAAGHTDWLSHPILKHNSYVSAMVNILDMNGNKNAKKMDVFQLLDIFEPELEYLYNTFDYDLSTHKSTRFVSAFLGFRLVYQNNPKYYDLIDEFLHEAVMYRPMEQGMVGKVGHGMFHNEFFNKEIDKCRFFNDQYHITTNPSVTFGLMVTYFEAWVKGKKFNGKKVTTNHGELENLTKDLFMGIKED